MGRVPSVHGRGPSAARTRRSRVPKPAAFSVLAPFTGLVGCATKNLIARIAHSARNQPFASEWAMSRAGGNARLEARGKANRKEGSPWGVPENRWRSCERLPENLVTGGNVHPATRFSDGPLAVLRTTGARSAQEGDGHGELCLRGQAEAACWWCTRLHPLDGAGCRTLDLLQPGRTELSGPAALTLRFPRRRGECGRRCFVPRCWAGVSAGFRRGGFLLHAAICGVFRC